MNPFEGMLGPAVVASTAPSAFQQDRPQQSRSSFADSSVSIDLPRLVLFGNQAQVRRNLTATFESMRIIDRRDQGFGCLATDTRDLEQPLDMRIRFGQLFQSRFDDFEFRSQVIQLSQFQIKLAFPEFVNFTLLERLTVAVDQLASQAPGTFARVDLEAPVGEQRADGVLDPVDPLVERFAILDQRALFADFGFGDVDTFEVTHHGHPGQPKRVVLVGFAFDVLPLPGFFVGAADQSLESQFVAGIADPAARSTGFHHDQIELALF